MPDIQHQPAYPSLMPQPDLGEDPWVIEECEVTQSKVSTSKHLWLPRPLLQEDMLVRQHELRHIRRWKTHGAWAPTGIELRNAFRRMADEIGLEITAYREGMNIYRARDHFDWTNWPFPPDRQSAAVQWLQVAGSVQFTKSGALKAYWQRIHQTLEARDKDILLRALKDLQADDSYGNCEKWADVLTGHFSPPVRQDTKPKGESKKAKEEREKAEEEEEEQEGADQGKPSSPDNALDREDSKDHTGWQPPQFMDSQPDVLPVDVHKHNASKYAPKSIMSQWTRAKYGSVLRYPQYLNPYGMVFGRRAQGGGMIIDVSSSMGWDHDALAKAIEKMPALWCAAYCSYQPSYNPAYGRYERGLFSARLCIIASGGKIGKYNASEPGRGTGNFASGCDLPSLMYAIVNSPKPLVWVSDGETGAHYPQIKELTTRYKVPRVRTMRDGIDFLMGKGVPGNWGAAMGYETPEIVRAR